MLVDADAGGDVLALTKLVMPPGGQLPEHDHAPPASLLVLLTGELTMTSGSHEEAITAGMVVVLDRHERVEVANKGRRTASTTMRRCTSTWPGIQCA